LTGATDGDGNTIPLGEIELPPDGPPYSDIHPAQCALV
jgi:hypothetical protein